MSLAKPLSSVPSHLGSPVKYWCGDGQLTGDSRTSQALSGVSPLRCSPQRHYPPLFLKVTIFLFIELTKRIPLLPATQNTNHAPTCPFHSLAHLLFELPGQSFPILAFPSQCHTPGRSGERAVPFAELLLCAQALDLSPLSRLMHATLRKGYCSAFTCPALKAEAAGSRTLQLTSDRSDVNLVSV